MAPGSPPQGSWAFQLLGEVIERALSTGRVVEADRLMRRAAKDVDDRFSVGERLSADHVSLIACFAVRLAGRVEGAEWVVWALTLHRRQERMLGTEVIDRLEDLDPTAVPQLRELLEGFLTWYESARFPSPDGPALARLRGLTVR